MPSFCSCSGPKATWDLAKGNWAENLLVGIHLVQMTIWFKKRKKGYRKPPRWLLTTLISWHSHPTHMLWSPPTLDQVGLCDQQQMVEVMVVCLI